MPPQVNGAFPTSPTPQGNLTVAGTNLAWGIRGTGSPEVWSSLDELVYRVTGATGVKQSSGIQYKEGFFYLIANTAVGQIIPKARFEDWTLGDATNFLRVGPVVADRMDSIAQPMELEPGEDPSGQIKATILDGLMEWGNMLPMFWFARMLTNGRVDPRYPVATCYDGATMFSDQHKINPGQKGLDTAGGIVNVIQLKGAVDEKQWTACRSKLNGFKDVDGRTLANVRPGPKRALVLCPSYEVATRWIHFLGKGLSNLKDLLMQANSAAVSSVVVGDAEVAWNEYLVSEVEAAADRTHPSYQFDPAKRSYIFSRRGRKSFIFWEKKTPVARETGENAQDAYVRQANVLFARMYGMMVPGEYRNALAVDEPQ